MKFSEQGRHQRHRGAGRPGGRGRGNPMRATSHGRRRGKIFSSEELQIVLLSMIVEKPRHGYDLIREIEARSNGAYTPSPGMVYPILTLFVEMGVAEVVDTSEAKKIFTATKAGEQSVVENADKLKDLMATLTLLADQKDKTDAPSIRRAIGNLKSAISDRLSQENVDKEVIFSVTELIDEAASKIERLN